ncbi:MAG TPA: hypothetical protein DEB17_00585 [Chlorobaculum sp.]|uniref:Uncharacterized protein n=1 Tax=Chlorobaculum tepidum (strain ATCC 49652 / DSM 12025 / NBRC 103806 / TLS) TaxID=194439 RepID=Q8KBZ0_CHLTE|nr:hypothetical protein CT1642 [Chlorobaculum tepidum TLS]HBU22496.1 hypothetical protein [Chlorobaculum sp.]
MMMLTSCAPSALGKLFFEAGDSCLDRFGSYDRG